MTAEALWSLLLFPFFWDPIFIVIDYEGQCGVNVILETGLLYLNTRDLGPRSKLKKTAGKAKEEDYLTPAVPPEDRGSDWFKFIRTKHFRIKENRHDRCAKVCKDNRHDHCTQAWHKGEAGCFAFEASKFISRAEIPRIMKDWLASIRTLNLLPTESERFVNLCAYDARMEEKTTLTTLPTNLANPNTIVEISKTRNNLFMPIWSRY